MEHILSSHYHQSMAYKRIARAGVIFASIAFGFTATSAWAMQPEIETVQLQNARFAINKKYVEQQTQHSGLPEIARATPRHITPHTITAYTSLPGLTDNSPFITASGSHVHSGTVAANCLPFGTKVQLPELFGDRVFTVEDRLHPRKGCGMIDVWMPTYQDAKNFGVQFTTVYIF
jgi:3D (Asp-Asp-Asp) domain-containing protein